MESYRTLLQRGSFELIDRRSRFIGAAEPVCTQWEAEDFLARERRAHEGARHLVYAYCLRSGVTRCSDDGEPQGTGGVPALQALQKKGLVGCAVAVTRFFGGILLGTGGLVRAYGAAAAGAVEAAGVQTCVRCRRCEAVFGYADIGRVSALIARFGAVEETVYGQRVRYRFHVPCDDFSALEQAIADATAGSAAFTDLGEGFWAV